MRPRLPLKLSAAAVCLAASPVPALAQAALVADGFSYAMPVVSMRDIPFRTVIRQQYDYSCGSAALATLLNHHYGKSVTEADIFQAMYAAGDKAKIRQAGFSLLDIKRYLEAHGLQADGYRASMKSLQALNRPGIAMITSGAYRHFVVVKGARGGKILVGDPSQGLKIYGREEFAKLWNGVIFLIGEGPAKADYNREDEWSPWASAPLGERLGDESLSGFTRELPPLYQITAAIDATPGVQP